MFLIRDKSHLVVHDGCAIAYFPDVSLACISPVQEGPKYTIARAPSDLPQSLSSKDKEQSWIEILVAFAKSFLRSAPNHFASLADTSEARLVSRRATWVSRALPYHPRPFAHMARSLFAAAHVAGQTLPYDGLQLTALPGGPHPSIFRHARAIERPGTPMETTL